MKSRRLIRGAKRAALFALETASAVRPRHWGALGVRFSETWHGRTGREPGPEAVCAAIGWLKASQDVTASGGCAWGHRARARIGAGETVGWQPAYPETTGYIIETMLRYGHWAGDQDSIERARRMADWELGVQLPDGGIPGGTIGAQPVESSTFVTGQVIFGWIRAHEEFGGRGYLDAACRAGDYLVSCQDETGRFVRGHSRFCLAGPKAYETRTGWALVRLGQVAAIPRYIEAGRKTAEFALACQQANGWLSSNDLDQPDAPLTHTIGYALEGLLEIGRLIEEQRFVAAARIALENLRAAIREDGFLPGRLNGAWQPTVKWCCLTGCCQLASVFFRMQGLFPDWNSGAEGERLLRFVASTQRLTGASPERVGGISGSFPFHGGYAPCCVLNWATKFYADAVMDYLSRPGA